jgi:hypothetical protein
VGEIAFAGEERKKVSDAGQDAVLRRDGSRRAFNGRLIKNPPLKVLQHRRRDGVNVGDFALGQKLVEPIEVRIKPAVLFELPLKGRYDHQNNCANHRQHSIGTHVVEVIQLRVKSARMPSSKERPKGIRAFMVRPLPRPRPAQARQQRFG